MASDVSAAEKAFIEAVAQAVLHWAGIADEREAKAPKELYVATPDGLMAEVIGENALERFRASGFRPSPAGASSELSEHT